LRGNKRDGASKAPPSGKEVRSSKGFYTLLDVNVKWDMKR